ncbi:MAG: beta-ribofuranosylaminobenzene 5'-phosphate synthase [Methanobrevibacter sp.]|nr:beta-ribofuranosylaminobenzene 5'-phosphate synthase [Methanobrevibacter sp.]
MIIKTPSRLHMTLIDLNGSYGRADGGIGLTIAKPNLCLKGEEAEKGIAIEFNENIANEDIKKESIKKISDSAQKVCSYFDLDTGFHFEVEEAYLPHSGLGSGTQISLATAKLICEHIGKNLNGVELANIVGRGGTSGVGIFSFDHGGFLVDGGHNLKEKGTFLPSAASPAKPPKLIGRYDFPEDWGIVVAIPQADHSVTGEKEIDLFQNYCPVPVRDVEQLSHLILMNLLPFLLEKDINSFGSVINRIQNLGFKKVEVSLQPKKVKSLMENMVEWGAYGVGMSSFGPTVYGIIDKKNQNVFKATKEFVGDDGIVLMTNAQNHGYELKK